MPRVCINCVRDLQLKILISKYGQPIKRCPNCGSVNELAVSTASMRVKQAFRAAIRYHMSEWEYNGHWGGEDFSRLLQEENPVIRISENYPYFDSLVWDITNPGYYDYDKGISLYAGYDENKSPYMLLMALKDDFCPFLNSRVAELSQKNYYEVEGKLVTKLKAFVGKIDTMVPARTEFFRARIGTAGRWAPSSAEFKPTFHYKPYEGNELGAPPPPMASAGRMNRAGVSYLYVTDEKDTAVAEVRPHPSHRVSIGKFINIESLCLADFSSVTFLDFLTDAKLDAGYLFLKSIDKAFSLPITPEKQQKYSITQALSESLRKLRYDGIVFRSTVGSGVNITAFYPENFSYVEGSGEVYKIKGVSYDLNPEPIVTEANKEELFDPLNF